MGSLVTSAVQSFCLFSAGNTSLQPQANHQLFSCPFGTLCSPLPSNSVSAKVVRFQVKPWTLADEWVKSPTVWGITDPKVMGAGGNKSSPSPVLHSWFAQLSS